MNTYPDYLRLTTWNSVSYALLASKLMEAEPGWKPGRFLQYRGRKSEQMFHGLAEQAGKRHYMIQASGYKSAMLLDLAKMDSVKCTRMDLQRTIRKPVNWNARKFYDYMVADEKNTRKLSIVQSSTGDTVYLGDRNSDTFIRIYEKIIDDQTWLRLEIEIKGQAADKAYHAIQEKKATKTEVYDTLLMRFRLPEKIEQYFYAGRDNAAELLRREVIRDKEKQLAWLMNLNDTIVKMANDHETGQVVREWLTNLMHNLDSSSH